jgi:hypothetical protein
MAEVIHSVVGPVYSVLISSHPKFIWSGPSKNGHSNTWLVRYSDPPNTEPCSDWILCQSRASENRTIWNPDKSPVFRW